MRTIHLYPLCLLVLLAVGLGTSLNSCTNDLPEPEQLVEPGTDADNALRPEDYVGKPVSFNGFTVTEVMTDADTRAVTRSDSRAFGEEGDVVTIKMRVEKDGSPVLYLADYVLSGGTWKPNEQNNLLCWESVNAKHNFTAYYPALNEQEKQEKGRSSISLPLDWTEENYLKYGRLMQSPEAGVTIGSPVSLSLQLLLTRIEVSIDDATGITDATHLTMYTRTKGTVKLDGTVSPIGEAVIDAQEMNLWRDTPASTTGTPANPVFRGYAIPQTYASGTTLLKHHTPDVDDARSYTVNYHPVHDGLTTNGGEIVSFTVAAIVPTVVDVPPAGKLKDVLNDAFPTSDYPTRLKITGGLNRADIGYLGELTRPIPEGQGVNITVVDMEGASVGEDAFDGDSFSSPFYNYNGSIKSLVLPSSLGTVPVGAFYGSSLTSVTLPEGLTRIGKEAFWKCKDLKNITLPSSVTALGVEAFAASGLTSIELPEDLTEIGGYAFRECHDLQQVALSGNKSITVGTNAFKDISSCQLFLYAPGLDTNSNVVKEYLTGTWGGFTWANVYWGYKGTGSKLDPENYEHSLK